MSDNRGSAVGTGKISGSVASLGRDSLFSGLNIGAKFFDPAITVSHFQPKWTGDCPLIFMPVGQLGESGEILPAFNFSTGEAIPSDFFMRLPVVSFMGSANKVEFPLFDPFAARSGDYDITGNPYLALLDAVKKFSRLESHKHWDALLKARTKDEGAVLPRQQERYFFQGLVFQDSRGFVGDKKGTPRGLQERDSKLCVISMSRNAGERLVSLIEHYAAGGMDGADSINLLDGKKGYYIVIANPDKHQETAYNPAAVQALDKSILSSSMESDGLEVFSKSMGELEVDTDDRGTTFVENVIAALPTVLVSLKSGKTRKSYAFPSYPFGKDPTVMNKIRMKYQSLPSIFHIPSHEDQIKLICRALEDKPEVLAAAYPENSVFFTEDVRRTISNRGAIRLRGVAAMGDSVDADPMAMLTGGTSTVMTGSDLKASSDADFSIDSLLGLGDGGTYDKAKSAMPDN